MWRRVLSSHLKSLGAAAAAGSCAAPSCRLAVAESTRGSFISARSSIFSRQVSSAAANTAVKKTVEDVMPIATGHEREELEAELEGRKLLDIDYPEGPFGTKEAPAVIRSYYDKRIVGRPGGEGGAMALKMVNRKFWSGLLAQRSSMALLHSHATSFGFKEVREEEKSKLVGNVFTNVASTYDLMNDLMSGGLHRLWKDRLVGKLNPFPGMKHLDVAGGTGDVAFRIFDAVNSVKHRALQKAGEASLEETQIYVCDVNPNMLNVGKKRAAERGLGQEKSLMWVEGDAEALSFDDNTMDGYTIAFGIRNVTHIEKAVAEAYRVLKRGGRFLCLELSHVETPILKDIYDFYSFQIIPNLGELVTGDRESYQYLVESIRRFPPQEKFASMIADAGFQKVEYENLVGGVVATHSGLKL